MRKVNFVRLHEGFHIPGYGDLGNVLPGVSRTLENLEMSVDSDFLYINFKAVGQLWNCGIPLGTVKGVVFAPNKD